MNIEEYRGMRDDVARQMEDAINAIIKNNPELIVSNISIDVIQDGYTEVFLTHQQSYPFAQVKITSEI